MSKSLNSLADSADSNKPTENSVEFDSHLESKIDNPQALFQDGGFSQDELKQLEKELHEKSEQYTFHQMPNSVKRGHEAYNMVGDQDTREFVQLVEFIKGEHLRNQKINNSQFSEKSIKVQRYDDIKNLDFERNIVQKGLQVNKAA